MIELKPCPICNKENERNSYFDDYGLVEEHYSCDRCGYFFNFAYGESDEAIVFDNAEVNWFKDIKEAWNRRANNG